jgi:putative endonuclease
MPFYFYIIHSIKLDQYYLGHTQDLQNRIYRHANSGSKSTKKSKDWKIVYFEEFQSRSEAVRRERQVKHKKSKKYIKWLITPG